MDKEAKQNKNNSKGKGMDWSSKDVYGAIGRPDLRPENREKAKVKKAIAKSIKRHRGI